VLGSTILTMATWPTMDDASLAPTREQTQRIGNTPGLRLTAKNLRVRRAAWRLGGVTVKGVRQSCAEDVAKLEALATADAPCTLMLADQRAGLWWITELAITPSAHTDSGLVAQAEVQATFTAAPGKAVRLGVVRLPGSPAAKPAKGAKR
jgi:hypothetical protein